MKYSEINNDFKLPIYYTDKKESIDGNIIIDLELNEFNIKNDNNKEHQDLSNNKSKLEITKLKNTIISVYSWCVFVLCPPPYPKKYYHKILPP